MDQNNTEIPQFKEFQLGQTVMTPGFLSMCGDMEAAQRLGSALVQRHASGDFGDLCEDDRVANLQAVSCEDEPGRVLSAYELTGYDFGKVWVITEWDRSVTTVLLPDEY